MTWRLTSLVCSVFIAGTASAHDTWVETNTNHIRTGDAVYIDLKLGNHGNEHRDFKLAGKVGLDACTLTVTSPDGSTHDILPDLVDTGYAPDEGYWSGKYTATRPGLYRASHTLDQIVNHGHPVRAIKSGKAFFVASDSLDDISKDHPGFDTILGHPLELVPETNPVTPIGPGQAIGVRLLLRGRPLAETRVSFVPRRQTLQAGFDERYERNTDADGRAAFIPTMGDQYLIVAHHKEPAETGSEYDETAYSATLSVFVPQVCPCCGE